MTTNHHIEELIEEKVKEFLKQYEDILPQETLGQSADWYRNVFSELYSQGLADGAAKERERILNRYSPDTWFKQKFAQMLDKRTKLFESLMKSA